MPAKIHPTAVIHPSAVIADGAELGPYVVIGESVSIGSGTYVGPHCYIEHAEIGKNNHFTGGAYIGTAPQDFSYHGEKTKLVVGDNNIVREGVSLHRGSTASNLTVIGSNCMLMANSHVGHDGRVGNGVVLVNSAGLSGHVEVGDKAIISGLSGVHQFARIGTMAMVGGGSMVGLDVPPYCRVQGDRAKLVGLNLVGMRRNGISKDSIKSVKDVYKGIFMSGMLLREAVAKYKGMNLSPEAQKFVLFCENSKRGIMRPRMARGRAVELAENE